MTEKRLVSILIPVYNREKTIGRTLDSVLAQTYRPIEVLIFDDGSNDQTPEILNGYCEKYECIRVLKSSGNKGVAFGRHELVAASRGEYLFFCDSDDFMDYETVRKAVDIIVKNTADLAIFQIMLKKPLITVRHRSDYIPAGVYNREEIPGYYFNDPINLFWCAVYNKCYKGNIARKHNYFPKEREDVYFNLEYLKHIRKVVILPDFLYTYDQTGPSIIRNTDVSSSEEICNALLNQLKYYRDVYDRIVSMFPDGNPQPLKQYFYKSCLSLNSRYRKESGGTSVDSEWFRELERSIPASVRGTLQMQYQISRLKRKVKDMILKRMR